MTRGEKLADTQTVTASWVRNEGWSWGPCTSLQSHQGTRQRWGRGFEKLEASIVSQWTISKFFEHWGWPPNQPQLALIMILTWQDLELDNCDHYIHFNLFVGQEFVLAIKLQVALRAYLFWCSALLHLKLIVTPSKHPKC